MATYADVTAMVASLMNDTARAVYTNTAILPYLNMALDELQEIFEHNNVPKTNTTSAVITVPAGDTQVPFRTSPDPKLPTDLIEIQQLWEAPEDQEQFIPMQRVEFLGHFDENLELNQFLVWAWMGQAIRLHPANQDIDLKIDYVANIFSPLVIGNIATDLPLVNSKTYLGYHTAALCAMFIGENQSRSESLEALAQEALARTLGINTKGRQGIVTRRRPFRSSYKNRGSWI